MPNLKAEMFNSGAKENSGAVLDSLDIKKGRVIADVGSGGGFFVFEFAERTGPGGKVYAVDTNDSFPAAYFRGLKHSLKPDGRVAVIDRKPGGSRKGHGTPEEEIKSAMRFAGFEIVQSFNFLKKQSFYIFRADTAK